jgi:pimeloyl-ACP methyl ester carboxylesterase
MTKQVLSKDGTKIAFDQSGEGAPVILVGGALQYRAIDPSTAQLAALLAENFTVFHYDRRGRGDSGDTPPYAVEREIEDLSALIDVAGESAGVFGMSSGAVLALRASGSLKITRLALYEPPFIVDDSCPPLPDDYLSRLNKLLSSNERGDAVALFMTEAVGVPTEYVAPMRSEAFWQAFETVAHTLAYDGAIMADTMRGNSQPLQQWASITVPTLVIDGGESPVYQQKATQILVEILPDAQRRTLEGQAHDVSSDVLAPVLREFFLG